MNNVSLTAIIPAHNEEDCIESTIRACRRIPGIDRIIVVDDGSTDRTAEIASRSGADLVRLPRRGGKGAALQCGLSRASTDLVLFLDADLSSSASNVCPLIAEVVEGRADMSIAILPQPVTPTGFGLVKRMAQIGIYFITGKHYKAPLSGQRCLNRRTCAPILEHLESGFGVEVGLDVDAVLHGLQVAEVDCELTHRPSGRDFRGFLHRIGQMIDVGKVLLNRAARFRLRKGAVERA